MESVFLELSLRFNDLILSRSNGLLITLEKTLHFASLLLSPAGPKKGFLITATVKRVCLYEHFMLGIIHILIVLDPVHNTDFEAPAWATHKACLWTNKGYLSYKRSKWQIDSNFITVSYPISPNIWLGGECHHHCAIPATWSYKFSFENLSNFFSDCIQACDGCPKQFSYARN